jgi:iron-sulfur cluster insertion protein
MSAEIYVPEVVSVSDSAIAKVRSLIEEEDNPDLKLRVYVTGGGCSGFQYGFTFDEALAEDDSVVEREGVKVVVDATSYPYLVGARVDYEEGLQGAKFVIQNPNAASTCGCGSSFSI